MDTLYLFRLELQSIMFTRLYLHIPFCRQKCSYCAFASRPGDETDADSYSELLLTEMQLARRGLVGHKHGVRAAVDAVAERHATSAGEARVCESFTHSS